MERAPFMGTDSFFRVTPADATPEALAEQLVEFFAKGGRVQVIPFGATAVKDRDWNGEPVAA